MSQQAPGPRLLPSARDGCTDPKEFLFLAETMASDEDATIFRRFDKLNILNLLVLQDEIQMLSRSYTTCQQNPENTEGLPHGYLRSYIPGQSSKTDSGANQEDEAMLTERSKATWKKLQDKLREYSRFRSTV